MRSRDQRGGIEKAPETSPDPKATKLATTDSAKVDIEEIFPAGKGRELVLNNCTSCHTIVPIVVLQMTRDAWERNGRDHRDRVTALSDAEFKTLYEYLIVNFNPQRPVPKLPKSAVGHLDGVLGASDLAPSAANT